MMAKIESINIKQITSQSDDIKNWLVVGADSQAHVLPNLGSVNIFCGENNSGKSRFLRLLVRTWDQGIQVDVIKKLPIEEFKDKINQEFSDLAVSRYLSLKITPNDLVQLMLTHSDIGVSNVESFWSRESYTLGELQNLRDSTSKIRNNLEKNSKFIAQDIENRVSSSFPNLTLKELLFKIFSYVISFYDEILELTDFSALPKAGLYIPILRTTHKIRMNESSDSLDTNYKTMYEIKEVMSGVSVYDQLRKYLLTSSDNRKKVTEYEKYLSDLFFEGKEVFLSPDNNKILLKIDGHGERELFNFGDGVTSLIILTFDAFFAEGPKCYFIEEPEIYLHPGMQRRFLDIITGSISKNSDIFSRHTWFFTTHSNHFLDLSLTHQKISVFNFRSSNENANIKEIKPLVLANDYSDRRLALESLGVQASSVFRVNKLVWVEGVTDILIIRKLLTNYLSLNEEKDYSSLREDIDFSFVIYGGSNLAQFDFSDNPRNLDIKVNSICDKNFVLMDGDVKNKPRGKEIIADKNIQGHLIDCKEVENLVSTKVLKNWVQITFERKLKKLNLQQIQEALNKIDLINDAEYEKSEQSVGAYLDNILAVDYFNEKGTIRDKVEFAHFVNGSDEVEAMFNSEGQVLTEKILSFLRS